MHVTNPTHVRLAGLRVAYLSSRWARAQLSPVDYMQIELTDKEIHLATP